MSQTKPENIELFEDAGPDLQPGLQPTAPSVPIRTSRLTVCRRCLAENAPGEQSCRKCGAFLPGNATRLVHGGRRRRVLELPDEVREAIELKRRLIADDLGGEASLSQLQRDLLERYLSLDALAAFQAAELSRGGMLTAHGRTRALFSAFLATCDKQVKLASLLGFERREKRAPTMAEYLEQLEAREATGRREEEARVDAYLEQLDAHESARSSPGGARAPHGEDAAAPPDRELLTSQDATDEAPGAPDEGQT